MPCSIDRAGRAVVLDQQVVDVAGEDAPRAVVVAVHVAHGDELGEIRRRRRRCRTPARGMPVTAKPSMTMCDAPSRLMPSGVRRVPLVDQHARLGEELDRGGRRAAACQIEARRSCPAARRRDRPARHGWPRAAASAREPPRFQPQNYCHSSRQSTRYQMQAPTPGLQRQQRLRSAGA